MAQAQGALGTHPLPATVNRVSLPFLRIRERRLLLATVDMALIALVMMGTYSAWNARIHPGPHNMAVMPWAWVLGAATTWLSISWLAGAYELHVADRILTAAKATITVSLFAVMVGLGTYWAFPKTFPRPALAIALATGPVAVLLWRSLYATLLRRPAGATRILVLGGSQAYGSLLAAAADRNHYHRLLGYVSPDERVEGSLGSISDLRDILATSRVHRIVVAPRVELSDAVVSALTSAIESGIEVLDFNSAYEEISEKVAVEHAGATWLAALPTRPQTSSIEELATRAIDVVGAGIGLAFTTILWPFIAVAIRSGSRGSIIYRQDRLGRGGKPFTLYKFRSMRADAEVDGARWAVKDDSRATGVGRFLRRTHLDELPQFWNVLRGDMSLVGPRPERPEFTHTLAGQIPFYRLRLSVRPGLTGLKQIKVGYASSPEEHLEVLRHDLYYIKHRSLALNLVIVARTLGSVLGRNGR